MSEIIFQTERLDARAWNAQEQAVEALALYGDPEVVRYIGNKLVANEAEQRAFIEGIMSRIAGYAPGLGSWPLFERDTGEMVGAALLKPLPASRSNAAPQGEIEIGWHLRRKHWRRGFATEAGRALVARGFDVVGLRELHAVVEPPNAASQAVAKRLGMQHRGQTNHYYDHILEHFVLSADAWHATHVKDGIKAPRLKTA